ncbi:MAG TPA: hypothetical protein VMU84_09665 [Thermoanaerobaculia bacterium]|nr:hypothetical protein [Thermoanaerobaculia bacterium]
MKLFTNIFRWLLGIGAAVHFLFGMIAMFAPDQLAMIIGLERMEFSYVWLGNLGMLIIPITMMTVAAAYDATRYRVYGWLVTLGRILYGIYWYGVAQNSVNAIFKPFSLFWLTLGVSQAIILLFFAEPEVRFSGANVKATLAQFKEGWQETKSNKRLRWFSYVAIAGMLFNFVWVFQALFMPNSLATVVGPEALFQSTTWLGITAVVLFSLTLLYLPSAIAPTKYFSYDWMIVVSRVIAATFWFSVWRQPYHGGFLMYFFSDGTFGLLLFFFLQTGAPADKKISADNLDRFFAFLSNTIAMVGAPRWKKITAFALVLVFAFAGAVSWWYFVRAVPDLEYGDDAEHYKYASVGLSASARIPYYVFEVLPEMFPELMPDPKKGYASFGLIQEKGQATPVGFSLREIGYKTIEPNCAMCHTASIRLAANSAPVVVPGAPAHELDLEGFQWFLYNCAASPKFSAQNLMKAINKRHSLSAMDSFMYENVILPATQTALLQQRTNYLWQVSHGRPWQGRGRTDTFNTTKLAVFKWPDDGSIGTTDLPQTWNQGRRSSMWLHWDGNNNSIEQRNYAAAMAVGATPFSVRPSSFKRVTDYLWQLEAAKYPLPIDAAKAAAGKQVFISNCADCHSWDSAKLGQVTQTVNSDPHRSISFTKQLADDGFHMIAEAPFRFTAYTKHQDGWYSNIPLDGIWARGPYLHHGAVPTLWDLLQPATNRPKTFYRGYNVLDPVKVGFVSDGAEAAAEGFLFDTSLAGNGNAGHEYGTTLSDGDKWALVEFLKTDDPLISGTGKPIPPLPAAPPIRSSLF